MSALAGIRVLDLGRYIAAPYCSMVLADLGAEVIRVERPGGDPDRHLGLQAAHGETYTFAALGRNKKGVTLDLTAGEPARELLGDLIAASDIVVVNFSRSAAAYIGVDYENVRRVRPDVIYAAVTGFGSSGPDAGRTGFDPIFQFLSGAAAVTGYEGNGPLRAGVPWVDYSTGLAAAIGVLGALRHRDLTGEGQEVNCALLQTAVSYMASIVAEAADAGRTRPRLGNQPAYIGVSNLYPCRDGEIYLVAVSEAQWRALCGVVGRPELAADAELKTPYQRYERRTQIDPIVAAWTSTRAVEQALEELISRRVPCGPLRSPAEVLEDAQVRANEMLPLVDVEQGDSAPVPVSASPFRCSAMPAPAPVRPPRAGEHNDEVYGGLLRYGSERLAQLRRAGVI